MQVRFVVGPSHKTLRVAVCLSVCLFSVPYGLLVITPNRKVVKLVEIFLMTCVSNGKFLGQEVKGQSHGVT